MPSIKSFARGFHGRPLLAFHRTVLEQYAKEHQLKWIEDESNQNVKHTRNFIRKDIMPLLKKRFPSVTTTIARSAVHCAEAQTLLEKFAQDIYAQVKNPDEHTLSVAKLLQLDPAKQRLILRTWIEQQGYLLPDAKKMETILRDVLTAAWDRLPCVSWESVEVRRWRDALYVMTCLSPHDTQQIFAWDLTQSLNLSNTCILQTTLAIGSGLRADIKKVSVRFRQGGEVIDVPGRGRLTLKNLFQEWNVLPWERDRIPLIYAGQKLIAVVGYMIDAACVAKKDEKGWEICLLSEKS